MKHEIPNVTATPSIEAPAPPIREALGDSEIENGELQERLDAVRNWTRDVFESHYPKFEPLTENRFIDFCEEQGLARIRRQKTAEPVLPQKKGREYFGWQKESYKESDIDVDPAAIEVYFDELIRLLEKKAEENASDVSSFREETVNHETSNPWFGHRLETTKKILLQARVWNNPAVRRAFTFPLSQEIANTLFISDMTEIERIALGLKSASPGELLDVIQSLPVPSDPFYDEDEDGKEVPENTAARRNKYRFILKTISEADVPVIRFAARHELSEMEEHWDAIDANWLARYEPTDSGLSELSSEQQTDAKRLRRKCFRTKGLPINTKCCVPPMTPLRYMTRTSCRSISFGYRLKRWTESSRPTEKPIGKVWRYRGHSSIAIKNRTMHRSNGPFML